MWVEESFHTPSITDYGGGGLMVRIRIRTWLEPGPLISSMLNLDLYQNNRLYLDTKSVDIGAISWSRIYFKAKSLILIPVKMILEVAIMM